MEQSLQLSIVIKGERYLPCLAMRPCNLLVARSCVSGPPTEGRCVSHGARLSHQRSGLKLPIIISTEYIPPEATLPDAAKKTLEFQAQAGVS